MWVLMGALWSILGAVQQDMMYVIAGLLCFILDAIGRQKHD